MGTAGPRRQTSNPSIANSDDLQNVSIVCYCGKCFVSTSRLDVQIRPGRLRSAELQYLKEDTKRMVGWPFSNLFDCLDLFYFLTGIRGLWKELQKHSIEDIQRKSIRPEVVQRTVRATIDCTKMFMENVGVSINRSEDGIQAEEWIPWSWWTSLEKE